MPYYTRLTYNSLDWTEPSGLEGKCSGKHEYLFECIAQFGFEEWYRSELFRRNEDGETWQYGYWQCFNDPHDVYAGNSLLDFKVYTKKCHQPCGHQGRYIEVADYKEVHVLSAIEREDAEGEFDDELSIIRNCLVKNGVHITHFDDKPRGNPIFNMKFKITDETYRFEENKVFNNVARDYRFLVVEY